MITRRASGGLVLAGREVSDKVSKIQSDDLLCVGGGGGEIRGRWKEERHNKQQLQLLQKENMCLCTWCW